jgi:hypothetical protein
MVRLLLVALAGAAAWYGWRVLRRQQDRVNKALWEAEASLARKEPVRLEKDPKTGIYRPTDRRD